MCLELLELLTTGVGADTTQSLWPTVSQKGRSKGMQHGSHGDRIHEYIPTSFFSRLPVAVLDRWSQYNIWDCTEQDCVSFGEFETPLRGLRVCNQPDGFAPQTPSSNGEGTWAL